MITRMILMKRKHASLTRPIQSWDAVSILEWKLQVHCGRQWILKLEQCTNTVSDLTRLVTTLREKMGVISTRMSKLAVIPTRKPTAARLIIYGSLVVTSIILYWVYLNADRAAQQNWPSDGTANWTRDIYSVDSPKDLRAAVTVMNVSFLNGQLSAFCAFKNMDQQHGVTLNVFTDASGLFWCPLALEAGVSPTGPWQTIRAGDSRAGDSKVLGPGEAITFNVELNDYRRAAQKYRYGRIVTPTGDSATLDLELLRPPTTKIPPG
jgi:hypothetical protein